MQSRRPLNLAAYLSGFPGYPAAVTTATLMPAGAMKSVKLQISRTLRSTEHLSGFPDRSTEVTMPVHSNACSVAYNCRPLQCATCEERQKGAYLGPAHVCFSATVIQNRARTPKFSLEEKKGTHKADMTNLHISMSKTPPTQHLGE